MSKPKLGPDTRVQRTEGHLASAVGEDTVVLHGDTGIYYGIHGVGSLIWQVIAAPATVAEIVARVVAEFDVDAALAKSDVLAFLADLVGADLVRILDS